jgi:hypothetical protein
VEQKQVELSRQELYEQVWSKPVTHLARDYGISNVGLSKICRKYNIPTPPLGYWSKVKAGKTVRKKPLPALNTGNQPKIIVKPYRAHPAGEERRSIPDEFQSQLVEATKRTLSFIPETEPASPHPLIKWARKSFKKPTKSYSGILIPSDRRCLDIQVTEQTIERAILFLDTLLKLIEECGYKITVNEAGGVVLDILSEKMALRVKERIKREETAKTLDPKLHTKSMLSYVDPDSAYRYTIKEYNYRPTGELCLIVKSHEFYMSDRRWCDKDNLSIEDQLSKIVPGLVKFAARSRMKRKEQEEWKRKRELGEAERREQYQLQLEKQRLVEEEQLRVEGLLMDAEGWHKSILLRKYVEAKRKNALEKTGVIDDKLDQWLRWAENQADRLDPLGSIARE